MNGLVVAVVLLVGLLVMLLLWTSVDEVARPAVHLSSYDQCIKEVGAIWHGAPDRQSTLEQYCAKQVIK